MHHRCTHAGDAAHGSAPSSAGARCPDDCSTARTIRRLRNVSISYFWSPMAAAATPFIASVTPRARIFARPASTMRFSIRAVVVKRFQANNSNFCRSRARASLRDQPLALPAWDQQEETEQSDSRTDRGRAIDIRVQSELVSSIVPRGTSLRWIVAPTVWRSSLRLSAPFPLSSGTRFHHSTCGCKASRNQHSEFFVHGPDGRIRERDSHGHDPNPLKG